MSKIIKITPECLEEIRRDFDAALRDCKVADGKITFTKTFGYINRKATVYFTELAWIKMQSLIREFNKEVAWHGVAKRGEDGSKDEYYITDILVYPQEVTGSTVNTDQEKYEMWLMQHDDDVFNNIRMQGHSHVNMGTTPSSVDTTHQEKILAQLEDDMFYIFMIWNKRGEKTIKIYDLAKNVLFDGTDVIVQVKDDTELGKFLKEAKGMVKDKTYASSTTYGNGYSGGNNYGSYSGYNNYSSNNTTSAKDEKSSDKSNTSQKNNDSKKNKRKGKRKYKGKYKGNSDSPVNACGGKQLSLYDDDYDPWDDYKNLGYWR